jgi:hypothetical protein
MKLIIFAVVSGVFSLGFNFTIASASVRISCEADGYVLYSKGEKAIPVSAWFTFEDTNENGVRVLKGINGAIDAEGSFARHRNGFKIQSLTENTKYRPIKYKGYSQFPNMQGMQVDGDDIMYGEFILAKDTSTDEFNAYYIFKSGDHFGGTLNLLCSKK